MNILIFDNYDSFTYNLVHLIKELGVQPTVVRNDKIALEEVAKYDKILLSPGPGIPSEAGIMLDLIKTYAPSKSIFGVCLGHQGIGESFGGTLYNLSDVYHGVATSTQIIDNQGSIFKNIPSVIKTCRYHSWVVKADSIPNTLAVTAIDSENNVMGLRHKIYDVQGVQFHPESYLTEFGKEMIANWLVS